MIYLFYKIVFGQTLLEIYSTYDKLSKNAKKIDFLVELDENLPIMRLKRSTLTLGDSHFCQYQYFFYQFIVCES